MTARIALIGLSGAGKTTVAPLLADRLGTGWADLDAVIERRAGTTVGALIQAEGEAAFRTIEAAALGETLREVSTRGLVLACGAGVLTREENRVLLRRSMFTVWLSVHPRTAALRLLGWESAKRPLLLGGATEDRLTELLAQRAALYEAAAEATIETDRKTPAEVALAIEALGGGRGGWGPSGS